MARKQTLVQLSDELLAALDQVSAQSGSSRSELIRTAIAQYLARVLETDEDRQIVEGYTRTPQQPDTWHEQIAIASIDSESW